VKKGGKGQFKRKKKKRVNESKRLMTRIRGIRKSLCDDNARSSPKERNTGHLSKPKSANNT